MNDSENIGGDGFPIQEYTVNIKVPIYPDKEISERENIRIMKEKNFNLWKETYENFYGKPLEYITENKEMVDEE